jgi:hypothetical protein
MPVKKNTKSPMSTNDSCKMCFQHLSHNCRLKLLVPEPFGYFRPHYIEQQILAG